MIVYFTDTLYILKLFFLYHCFLFFVLVFCTVATLDEETLNGYHSSDRPLTLPADISNMLCTLEQAKW